MSKILVNTIIDQTKILFFNFSVTLKTCDMNYVLCDMPIWKHIYHTLHSLDQWYINPERYDEPPFHEPKLNSLDYPVGDKVLSREELTDYFDTIQTKIMNYLDSLNDDDLCEKPVGCKYNCLSLVFGAFRHLYAHLGNINATTIVETNEWPRVVGTYALENGFEKYSLYE